MTNVRTLDDLADVIQEHDTGKVTRYVVHFHDAPPTLTHIDGLVGIIERDEKPQKIYLLTPDTIVEVNIELDEKTGAWNTFIPEIDQQRGDYSVVETIAYKGDDVLMHEVYVDGYDNDVVPKFV